MMMMREVTATRKMTESVGEGIVKPSAGSACLQKLATAYCAGIQMMN